MVGKIRLTLLASAIGIATAGFAGNALAGNPPYYSWEAASEFDDTSNANGNNCTPPFLATAPWCYGYETVLAGAFTAFTFMEARTADIKGWGVNTVPANSLGIFHNIQPYPLAYLLNGQPGYQAHALDFLPGNNCEYAVLRFYAPYKARYKISGQFYGLWDDNNGYENADVHIYVNGAPVDNSLIDMANLPTHVSFTTRVTTILAPGGTIDFIVGCGTNGNNYYDHVGLNAVIERK